MQFIIAFSSAHAHTCAVSVTSLPVTSHTAHQNLKYNPVLTTLAARGQQFQSG